MSVHVSNSAIGKTQNTDTGLLSGADGARTNNSAKTAYVPQCGYEVVAIRLDEEVETVRALGLLLSPLERIRASRFAFDLDRSRFIIARAKLRQFLGERLQVRPASVELVYGPRGKPALAPQFARAGLRFNVSHSNNIAVYAFASGREVGIDVEAVRAIKYADSIAARLFSRFENNAYLDLDPEDRPLGFFNCWTRKEAFIKALGEGLYYPLNRFDVSLAPGEPAKLLRVEDKRGSDSGWHLDAFCPAPGYVAAIVTENL
jgi:4'-phosphopantetheinyl transferase